MITIETSENAKSLNLQTHYYKASYQQIKALYLEILKSLGHNIVSDNDAAPSSWHCAQTVKHTLYPSVSIQTLLKSGYMQA